MIKIVKESISRFKVLHANPESREILWWAAASIILVILYQGLSIGSAWPMQRVITRSVNHEEWLSSFYLLIGFQLAQLGMFVLLDQAKHGLGLLLALRFKIQALDDAGMQSISPSAMEDKAEQFARLDSSNSASGSVMALLMNTLPGLIYLIGLVVGLWAAAKIFGTVGTVGLLICTFIVVLKLRSLQVMERERYKDEYELKVLESRRIQELPIRFSFGQERVEIQKIKKKYTTAMRSEISRHLRWNLAYLQLYLSPVLIMLILVGLTLQKADRSQISVGVLYIVISWSSMYAIVTKDVQRSLSEIMRGRVSWEGFQKAIKESLGSVGFETLWPAKTEGNIVIRNLTIQNEGYIHPLLDNVSLDIPLGSCLLLNAPSGKGKSTLLHLLQLDHSYKGSVKIDGVELRDIDSLKYRENYLSVLLQKMYLFTATIRENLVVAKPNATDLEMLSVLKRFSMSQESADGMSLDYDLRDKLAKLSGGQEQRIALARVFLKSSAKIFLIDEPTDSLDSENVKIVLNEFAKLARDGNKTIIIATHDSRFNQLVEFRIMTIKEGKINLAKAAS